MISKFLRAAGNFESDGDHEEDIQLEVNVVQPYQEENASRETDTDPRTFVEQPSTGDHSAVITTYEAAPSRLLLLISFNKFPKREFQGVLIDQVTSGQVFRGCTHEDIVLQLGMVYDELYQQDAALAEMVWAILTIIGDKLDADEELHPVLFGEAKSQSTVMHVPVMSVAEMVDNAPAPNAGPSRNSRSGGEVLSGQRRVRVVGMVQLKQHADEENYVGQKDKTHWTRLGRVRIGQTVINAVADQGTEVSLITRWAADGLGLTVRTEQRPWLKSAWASDVYQAYGTARAKVEIEDGPCKWLPLVVLDEDQPWELLIGN
ncbi:hypothetical protein H4R20_000278 [Coemansia guatemalensis]|uniref:Uncharacterized protein n=1 Tax=Coemansia guatemalensis TaxID=2761395 RepID=A0A9W8I5J0_9FUNG|nr:hypothetical protein H4R20_000278 [Coemansia guatemalensis]